MTRNNNEQGIIADKNRSKPSLTFLSTSGQGAIAFYNNDFHFNYQDGTSYAMQDIASGGSGGSAAGSNGTFQIANNGSFDEIGSVLSGWTFRAYSGALVVTTFSGQGFNLYDDSGLNMTGALILAEDSTISDFNNGCLYLNSTDGEIYAYVNDAATQVTNQSGGSGGGVAGSNGYIQINNQGSIGTSDELITDVIFSIEDGSGMTGQEGLYAGNSSYDSPYMMLDLSSTDNYLDISLGNESGLSGTVSVYPGFGLSITSTDSSGTVGVYAGTTTDLHLLATGYVEIEPPSVHTLQAEPSAPTEGMMYASSADNKFHVYIGGSWYSLDMTAD